MRAGEWENMTPPTTQTGVEYVAPVIVGSASVVVGLVLDAPVAHALLVSGALVGGMAAGAAVRLFARRLRPPRTDG